MFDYSKYKNEKVVVAWTGGLDSTLVLLEFLKAGAKVVPFSVTGKQLPNPNHEAFAREKMLEVIRNSKWGGSLEMPQSFEMPSLRGVWPGIHRYSQHSIWMRMIPLAVPVCRGVAIGYVSTDGFFGYEEEMCNEWYSGRYNVHDGEDYPELILPLKTMNKTDVRNRLIKLTNDMHLQPLKRHITFCHNTLRIGNYLFRCGACSNCNSAYAKGTHHFQPLMGQEDSHPSKIAMEEAAVRGELEIVYLKEGNGVSRFYRIPIDKDNDGIEYFNDAITVPKGFNKAKYGLIFFAFDIYDKDALKKNKWEEIKSIARNSIIVNRKDYDRRYGQWLLDRDINNDELAELVGNEMFLVMEGRKSKEGMENA